MRELSIPVEASGDPEAFEYVRLWSTERGDQTNFLVAYGDAEVWGIALADLGRTIARRLAANDGSAPEDQLAKIEAAFRIEMNAQFPRV